MTTHLSCLFRSSMWVMFLGLTWSEAQAQTWNLSEGMRTAQHVASQLNLPEEFSHEILRVALACDSCLSHWKMYQDSLQQAPLDEAEILRGVQLASVQMRVCRERRTMQMREGLPDSLRSAFDDLNPPDKPQVMHFGLHNRMDCNVCKTQKPRP